MVTELVALILQNLVSEPEQLEVGSRGGAQGLTIEIRCAPEDVGRIIGRGGRTINSVRTLARAASEGQGRVEVQLLNA